MTWPTIQIHLNMTDEEMAAVQAKLEQKFGREVSRAEADAFSE